MASDNRHGGSDHIFILRALFKMVRRDVCQKLKVKSPTQVVTSVAPAVSPSVIPKPKAGRSPKPRQANSCSMSLKLRPDEKEKIKAMAEAAEMSVNGYIRAKSLGTELIEKPNGALKDTLHRLYVELAAQGNNINQITRSVNRGLFPAESGLLQVGRMTGRMGELMNLLQWTLAGRQPPDDY